jgi:hypothetical protein
MHIARITKPARLVVVSFLVVMSVVTIAAAETPVSFQLVRTSVLYNEDPPGAPLPLGRTQYDAGDILFGRQIIGNYIRVKDIAPVPNAAAVTITLLFPGDPHPAITLQGSHSFNSGNEIGSISACAVPSFVRSLFSYDGATDTLTLILP